MRVRDPLRYYKSYVFFQRETEQLLTTAWDDMYPTASQQSVPYSLDYRTTISNYDSQFGWELSTHDAIRIYYYSSDLTQTVIFPSTFQF